MYCIILVKSLWFSGLNAEESVSEEGVGSILLSANCVIVGIAFRGSLVPMFAVAVYITCSDTMNFFASNIAVSILIYGIDIIFYISYYY